MKRFVPGLHERRNGEDILEGVFLARVDRAFYRWHPQRPFYVLRLGILEPEEQQGQAREWFERSAEEQFFFYPNYGSAACLNQRDHGQEYKSRSADILVL